MDKDKNHHETLLQEIRNKTGLKMPTPDAIGVRIATLPKSEEKQEDIKRD